MKHNNQLIVYTLLSILALILLLIIGFFSENNQPSLYDRLIVGFIFSFSLLFGISISLKPGWYKQKKDIGNKNLKNKKSSDFKGHHPNCEGFSDHTITIKNKTYCTGCLGLLIGSIINITLIITYLVLDIIIIDFEILLIIGIILVLALLIFFIFIKRNPLTRVVTNSIYVVSFFFIVVSILEITGSFVFGLLAGLFCFLFIDTRIKISKWTHINTCKNCEKDCKIC